MHYLGHEGAVAEHSLDLLHCHVLALGEGTRKEEVRRGGYVAVQGGRQEGANASAAANHYGQDDADACMTPRPRRWLKPLTGGELTLPSIKGEAILSSGKPVGDLKLGPPKGTPELV